MHGLVMIGNPPPGIDPLARWEHFSHGADIGVRGIGSSLASAFAECARAMTAAAVDPDLVSPTTPITITCSGANAEDLLFAWLNAVVFEMATRRMIFGRFDVDIAGNDLSAVAWGEGLSHAHHQPAVEVKGATLTALDVRQEGDVHVVECVVDV